MEKEKDKKKDIINTLTSVAVEFITLDKKQKTKKIDLDSFYQYIVCPTMTAYNIIDICSNNIELIREYTHAIQNSGESSDLTKAELQFAIDNSDKISPNRYLLSAAKLCATAKKGNQKIYDITKELIKNNQANINETLDVMKNAKQSEAVDGKLLDSLVKVGKNIQGIIPDTNIYIKTGEIEFADSNVLFRNKKIPWKKNKDSLIEIGNALDDFQGLNELITLLSYDDICESFLNEEIGKHIIICIQDRLRLGERGKKNISLRNYDAKKTGLKDLDYLDILLSIDKSIPISSFIEELTDQIYYFSYYLDFDKFILICAKRCEELLELNADSDQKQELYNKYLKLLTVLKKHLKNPKCEFIDKDSNDTFTNMDLDKLIKRLSYKKYISKRELNYIKSALLSGKINVDFIENNIFEMLYLTNEELESIMNYSLNNFIYVVIKLNYKLNKAIEKYQSNNIFKLEEAIIELYRLKKTNSTEILNLYNQGKLSIDFFKQYKRELTLDEVSLSNINSLYLDAKHFSNESDKLSSLITVYKAINCENNEIDRKTEENMIDYIEDEEDLYFYYVNGLISLETVADLGGESVINNLFTKNIIDITEIEKLFKYQKVDRNYLEKCILSSTLTDEELMNYINKRYISDENIIKIFENRNIFIKEAKQLFRNGIIKQSTYNTIRNRNLKELERRVGRNLIGLTTIDDDDIPNIKSDLNLPNIKEKRELKSINNTTGSNPSNQNIDTVIDPEARIDFLNALQARRPKKVLYSEFGETHPFYNYNFYVVQEKCLGDDIKKDAIIIAERFFKNRKKKKGTATNNATYVMRYEDYLILQGKQKELESNHKRQIIKEVPGAIYAINHRSGSWATNVVKAIAKARAGSNFDKLTHNEQLFQTVDWLHTLYNDNEFDNILEYLYEIDDEEMHTYYKGSDGKYRKLFEDDNYQYIKEQ